MGLFTLDGKIPGVMFWLGAADPDKLAHAKETGVPLPGPHSPLFAPVYATHHHHRRNRDDRHGARSAEVAAVVAVPHLAIETWTSDS